MQVGFQLSGTLQDIMEGIDIEIAKSEKRIVKDAAAFQICIGVDTNSKPGEMIYRHRANPLTVDAMVALLHAAKDAVIEQTKHIDINKSEDYCSVSFSMTVNRPNPVAE